MFLNILAWKQYKRRRDFGALKSAVTAEAKANLESKLHRTCPCCETKFRISQHCNEEDLFFSSTEASLCH